MKIGDFVVRILLWPVLAVWWAFVARLMWLWFVVPLGMPEIGKAHIYGLTLLLVSSVTQVKEDEDVPSLAHSIAVGLVKPSVLLVAGYVTHLFMAAP